jgi:hypothetical protein
MKTRVIVNEEKRTCVFVIEDAEFAAENAALKSIGQHLSQHLAVKFLRRTIPNKFVGKAKCNPTDDFDSKIGIRLARDRAFKKLNRAIAMELFKLGRGLNKAAEAIEENVNKLIK